MTMSQFALRWILMSEAVSCVIPGAKRPDQVEENCRAADSPAPRRDHAPGARDLRPAHHAGRAPALVIRRRSLVDRIQTSESTSPPREAGYALLVLAWFIVPLFTKTPATLVPPLLPVSFLDSAPGAIIPFLLVACVVSPIPLLAVFKIAAPFLESRIPSITDPKRIVAIVLDILLSGLVLATLAIHLFKEASGPATSASSPPSPGPSSRLRDRQHALRRLSHRRPREAG